MRDRRQRSDSLTPPRRRRGCLWAFVRLFDGIAVGVVALALVARHVRPTVWTWPLQVLSPALPFLAAALAGVALLRLWRTTGRVRAMYALVLVWAAVRFGAPPGAVAPPSDGDLTLTTYNVPITNGTVGRRLARRALAFVGETRPDVLLLQEASRLFHYDMWQRLEILPLQVQLRDFGYRNPPEVEHAAISQPVFLRGLETVSAGGMRLSDGGGIDPTDVARVELRRDSAAFVLYNLHLTTHGARKPWRERAFSWRHPSTWRPYVGQLRRSHLRRAAEADSLRARLDRETDPLLVAGDFNATPHEWVFGRIAGARGGLTDVLGRAGRGWNATFHSRWPVVRIDHVLASSEWAVVSAHRPRVAASDHLPVAVRLRLRPPGEAR